MYYSLAELWPVGNSDFPLLQYIDPYGNAIFNGLQMSEVKRELSELINRASNDEQRSVLRRVLEMAEECEKHPHKFLRFRGD
ncbi:MAG TPA: hypothetical protein VFP59_05545 [Candidatus Angelobacter sp.]|nr:hypothetical protein [Candidatus Angelobacter sp.]